MNWVVVNMPWRINRSTEAADLGQKFCAAVDAAKARWKAENPELAELELSMSDTSMKAIEIQDDYPWVKLVHEAASAKEYRDNGLRHLVEAPLDVQPLLNALLLHRYVYRLQNDYINNDSEVTKTSKACQDRRDLERTMEFIHHAACQVGVQIEVVSNGETKRLLIGDIVKDGMDSGCCSSGISDEDTVVRYRDLRPLLKEQDA